MLHGRCSWPVEHDALAVWSLREELSGHLLSEDGKECSQSVLLRNQVGFQNFDLLLKVGLDVCQKRPDF